jgi:hypothetical protein
LAVDGHKVGTSAFPRREGLCPPGRNCGPAAWGFGSIFIFIPVGWYD